MVALLKNRWCVCMAIKAFSLMVLSCSLLASVCVYVCVFLDTQFDLIYFFFENEIEVVRNSDCSFEKVNLIIIDLLIIGPSRFGNIAVR